MKQESPYSYQATVGFVQDNFALLIVAVLFFVGGFFFGKTWTEAKGGHVSAPTAAAVPSTAPAAPDASGPTKDQLALMPKLTDSEHTRGGKNPTITLVEYSDFECPFCSRFHPTTKQILSDYGDKVQLIYRQYPLPFHPNAQKAAEGSECVNTLAGNDGFWKYADAIFAENEKLGGKLAPESITTAAKAAGVDMAKFKACLDSGEMTALVKASEAGGAAAGINGTPGTIVITKDGAQELINGAYPYEQVKPILDKYL